MCERTRPQMDALKFALTHSMFKAAIALMEFGVPGAFEEVIHSPSSLRACTL